MKILLSIIFCLTVLSACGQKMVWDNPEMDYQKCLEKYGNDSPECEEERAAYGRQQEEMPPIDDSAANPDPGDYGPNEDPGY
jgi:hypothetical protein